MIIADQIASAFETLRRRARPTPQRNGLPAGFSAINEIAAEDIVVAGYPKSGNTWFQALIAGAVYGVSPQLSPDSLVQDLVPDLHVRKFYRRHQTPTFFKSHHLPRPDFRRVILLLRDGRDVMISYWHYLKTIITERDVSLRGMIETGDGLICRWHEHVGQWLDNPFQADCLTVKYEDLRRDAAGELRRVCDFARIVRSPDLLAQVAEQCRFENMQERERRLGWEDPDWPKDKPFVRRGEVGGYRDEFPSDCLAEFMAQAGETLRRCGYQD